MSLQRSPALSKVLNQWTDRNLFHIEKGGRLSNHMSHGLIALGYLNATEERLNQLGEFYREKLVLGHKIEPAYVHDHSEIASQEELLALRGQHKNFLGIVDYFKNEMAKEGSTPLELVTKYAPYLTEGVCGRLAHPLITLGYGIFAEQQELIIDGLAYMVFGFRTVGKHDDIDLDHLFKESNSESPAFTAEAFINLVHQVKEEKKFDGIVAKWREDSFYEGGLTGVQLGAAIIGDQASDILDGYLAPLFKNSSLIEAFLKDQNENSENYKQVMTEVMDGVFWLYNAVSEEKGDSDFILLHGVTSCWSLSRILPYLSSEERLKAILYYLRTLLSLFMAVTEPYQFDVGESPYTRDFTKQYNEIPEFQAPISHIFTTDEGDEHKIKMVFTCIDRLTDPFFTSVTSDKYTNMLKVIAARQFDILQWEKPQ